MPYSDITVIAVYYETEEQCAWLRSAMERCGQSPIFRRVERSDDYPILPQVRTGSGQTYHRELAIGRLLVQLQVQWERKRGGLGVFADNDTTGAWSPTNFQDDLIL